MTDPSNAGRRFLPLLAILLCAGCGDSVTPTLRPDAAVALTQFPGGCGAQFTATVTEEDTEVASLDMPSSTTESSEVCETWTGSDYQYQVRTSSESDADVGLPPDDVQGMTFFGGTLTPTDNVGQATESSASVNPTLFEMVNASPEQIQASYDDPYYGIYSGCPPPQIQCEPQPNIALSDEMVKSNVAPDPLLRHGLTRRGVRALIAGAEEIGLTARGERRFRVRRGAAEITYTVDPVTQLLVGEDYATANALVAARHAWRRTPFGFVKERTDIDITETVAGATIRGRSTLRVANVRINGQPVQ